MLALGFQTAEYWELLPDSRVLWARYLAFGMLAQSPTFEQGQVDAGWTKEIVPLAALPMKMRREVLTTAMGEGWQPPTAELRQVVIDAGLEAGLLDAEDMEGWTPPRLPGGDPT